MYALRQLLIQQALKKSSGNLSYPGLIAAWSAKGKTNDDEDRAILKDLTGNRHDITLNGFAFSEMSGYGGYDFSFKHFNQGYNSTKISVEIVENSGADRYILINTSLGFTAPSFKIKYNVIGNSSLKYTFYNENGERIDLIIVNQNSGGANGEYTIPQSYSATTNFTGMGYNARPGSITIELIPIYPDALVFDGVDDYGINEDMPILTDYTIIVKRKIGNKVNNTYSAVLSKRLDGLYNGAFVFERPNIQPDTWSFGAATRIDIETGLISWQTVSSYNGTKITKGSFPDTNKIFIGLGRGDYMQSVCDLAFYSAYLFDRSLDEQEIKSFIRKHIDPEYLLPSEIPTPDCYYDFSKGSNDDETRDTIKDLSGNGNDAVAHNFAWGGMSGYGGYVTNFYNTKENTITADIQNNKLNVTNITGNGKFAYTWAHSYPDIINNSYKIQVNGLKDTMNLVYRYYDKNKERKEVNIAKDGVYQIPSGYGVQGTETIDYSGFNVSNFTGECNLIIEMIPEYPGALVFDGVDDYVSLDAFNSGFKTMFMLCNPLKMNNMLYDQRTLNIKNDFALYLEMLYDLAYNSRNINGTYINNKFNNYHVENTLNKKQLIMVKSKLTENYKPIIGSNQSHNNFFANMALYKFLGFKEALTEEQIQAVIKKYNLLDGVDKIEVS